MINYENKPLDKLEQYRGGTAYIGVASAEIGGTEAHLSIERIVRRPGDTLPNWKLATKGAEAREHHVRQFLQSEHAFLFLLDADMEFPSGILERVRSHGLSCVSAHYVRRARDRRQPVLPIWFEDDPEFGWPMVPFRTTPEPGRMYRLGATGSGCWLIHRDVLEAVQPILKGEPFFLDDDMDIWPYDLGKLLAGSEKPRMLRGRKDRVGSDLRLGFFIRQAGFTIWGDPDAQCGHYIQYPLGMADWMAIDPRQREGMALGIEHDLELVRAEQAEKVAALKEADHVAV